jgi:hypothetical protein
MPVRELHNDLLKDPPAGLAEARDVNDKCVISITMLHSLLPLELKPATKRHKQMCNQHIKFLDNQLEVNGVEANRLEVY